MTRPIYIKPGTPGITWADVKAQARIIVIDHVPLAKASSRISATGEMVPRQKPFRVVSFSIEEWFTTLAEAKAHAEEMAKG